MQMVIKAKRMTYVGLMQLIFVEMQLMPFFTKVRTQKWL